MDSNERRNIEREIAILEADNRGIEGRLRSKRSVLAETEGAEANRLRTEIDGAEKLLAGNIAKIRAYKARL